MKRILAVALFVATSVQAQELKFGDLNYFLPGGQFIVSADLNVETERYKDGGTDVNQDGYYLYSQLRYGLNEKFNVFGGLNYQYKVEVEDGSDKRYAQDGLQNPYFGATYRFMQQGGSGVIVDFGAVANVAIQDEEVGTSAGQQAEDGNAATGRNSLEVNASVGRKWNEANEFRFTAGVVQNFEGEYDELAIGGGSQTFDIDPSTDLFLKAAYQYRPVNEFMMAVALQGTRVGEVERTVLNTTTTDESHVDFTFSFNAKYLVTENVIARFNFAQGNNADVDSETAGVTTEIKDRRYYLYGLGVDYLF